MICPLCNYVHTLDETISYTPGLDRLIGRHDIALHLQCPRCLNHFIVRNDWKMPTPAAIRVMMEEREYRQAELEKAEKALTGESR